MSQRRGDRVRHTGDSMFALLSLAPMLVTLSFAQDAAPEFEVATVKQNHSVRNGIGNRYEPQRMAWTNAPLKTLIEESFDMRPYQVAGGPEWIAVDKWDIQGTTAVPTTRQQKLRMLRTLLVQRFQLRTHLETRTLPIFDLLVSKNGPKLTEHKDSGERAGITPGRGLLKGAGITMHELAFWLSIDFGKLVSDKTGLTGKYDFDLHWNPDEGDAASPEASVFTAVGELGLKLKSSRGPVDVLVIDSVARPLEN